MINLSSEGLKKKDRARAVYKEQNIGRKSCLLLWGY